MANKFTKKVWKDRQSQHPTRRRLIPTGIENVYDIERVEGQVTEQGNAYDEDNMNDVENRVYNAFGNLDDTDIAITDSDNLFTATKLDGVLKELFMYAANAKAVIANAIGGISSSSSFQVLANAITNGKAAIASAIGTTAGGTPTSNNSLTELANYISNYKRTYAKLQTTGNTITVQGTISSYHVNVNFGFTPTEVLVKSFAVTVYKDDIQQYYIFTDVSKTDRYSQYHRSFLAFGVENITSNGFDVWVTVPTGFKVVTHPYDPVEIVAIQ
jgi:hypothetical protein